MDCHIPSLLLLQSWRCVGHTTVFVSCNSKSVWWTIVSFGVALEGRAILSCMSGAGWQLDLPVYVKAMYQTIVMNGPAPLHTLL